MSVTSLRVASSLWTDVGLVVGPFRPHSLIVGPAGATSSFVDALREDLRQPLYTIDGASPAQPPDDARTIILRHLDALDARGQLAMMARIEVSAGRLQVISLAQHPPFARVQRGLLMEPLYRRLSVVYLVIDACDSWDSDVNCA